MMISLMMGVISWILSVTSSMAVEMDVTAVMDVTEDVTSRRASEVEGIIIPYLYP